ncbi:E7 [Wesgulfec papillomavirus]|nr:E7 [Wesgulfec papillomavirus]
MRPKQTFTVLEPYSDDDDLSDVSTDTESVDSNGSFTSDMAMEDFNLTCSEVISPLSSDTENDDDDDVIEECYVLEMTVDVDVTDEQTEWVALIIEDFMS